MITYTYGDDDLRTLWESIRETFLDPHVIGLRNGCADTGTLAERLKTKLYDEEFEISTDLIRIRQLLDAGRVCAAYPCCVSVKGEDVLSIAYWTPKDPRFMIVPGIAADNYCDTKGHFNRR